MRSRSGKAENISIHGGDNEIKIITTINIVSENHAISVMEESIDSEILKKGEQKKIFGHNTHRF